MPGHLLFVSPIPSHPPDQGNGARILALGRAFQAAGWIVHFLYYPLEGLTAAQAADMAATWDHLHSIPCTLPDFSTHTGAFQLDDWWDDKVADTARALHKRWRFAAVVVNYVWFSAVLEAFGNDALKILDTHDVFGDRDKRLQELGLSPAWYYTTPVEEAKGLNRADIVLAIQDDEAAYFRQAGHRDVRLIGHILGRRVRQQKPVKKLRAGYIASSNPLNVQAFQQFAAAITALPDESRETFQCIAAGAICAATAPHPAFTLMGRVAHTDDFYDQVDVVINPMAGGTGLKIKSVEALFEGLPLIATKGSMSGLPAIHPSHNLNDAAEVAATLLEIAQNSQALTALHAASKLCAAAYAASVAANLATLLRDMG